MQSKTQKLLNYSLVSGISSTFFAYMGYRIGRDYRGIKHNEAAANCDKSMEKLDKAVRSYLETCDRYLRKLDEVEARCNKIIQDADESERRVKEVEEQLRSSDRMLRHQ